MQEGDPVTKLRTLMPDSRHVLEKLELLYAESGIPLKVRKNSGTHLEFPKDDPKFPYAYTLQKNAIITPLVAENRFPAGWTTTDRSEDYLARALFSGGELPTSIEELLRVEAFNPLLRVSVLVQQNSDYATIADLNKDNRVPRVVSSYLGLAQEYFQSQNTEVLLEKSWGKEEELVHDGDADAAVVVVDKGRAMRRFELRELGDPVMGRRRLEDPLYGKGALKLVLICNPDLLQDENIRLLVDKLMGELQGSQEADENPRNHSGLLIPFPPRLTPQTSAVAGS